MASFYELFPALSKRLKPGVDPTKIPGKSHGKVEVKCMGEGCGNYVIVRPDNLSRRSVPLVYCQEPSCRDERRGMLPQRSPKENRSLNDVHPVLARQLLGPFKAEDIPGCSGRCYQFACMHCGKAIEIVPRTIKDGSDSWAVYCSKASCQKKRQEVKREITRARGSYEKETKNIRESFSYNSPDAARWQHPSCDLVLSVVRKNSNKIGLFECAVCGGEVAMALCAAKNHTAFYCVSPQCSGVKKEDISQRQRNTRIKSRGTFAENHPELVREWVECVSDNNITPYNIPPNSRVVVRWRCSQKPEHIWERSVDGRVTNSGCPFCKSNVSGMQLRFSAEIAHMLGVNIRDSEKVDLGDGKVEVDIPIYLDDGRRVAVEIDGYEWHRKKLKNDRDKNKRLKGKGWLVVRVRDSRLRTIGRVTHSDLTIYVSSNPVYESQWRSAIKKIVRFLGYELPSSYDSYHAEKFYQQLRDYYGLGGA